MNRASIEQDIVQLAARIAGPARAMPAADGATPLADGGYWLTSLDLVDLVVACERHFGVVLEPETDLTAESLQSVGTLAETVARRLADPAPDPDPRR